MRRMFLFMILVTTSDRLNIPRSPKRNILNNTFNIYIPITTIIFQQYRQWRSIMETIEGRTEQMEIKKRCAKAHRSHYEIFIYNC